MQEKIGVGGICECSFRSGRGKEEGESKCSDEHERHEGNHVLDNFNHNAKKDASALEQRKDLKGLHALEKAQQSEEHSLGATLRGRLINLSHRCSEVGEGESEAEDIDIVPEI